MEGFDKKAGFTISIYFRHLRSENVNVWKNQLFENHIGTVGSERVKFSFIQTTNSDFMPSKPDSVSNIISFSKSGDQRLARDLLAASLLSDQFARSLNDAIENADVKTIQTIVFSFVCLQKKCPKWNSEIRALDLIGAYRNSTRITDAVGSSIAHLGTILKRFDSKIRKPAIYLGLRRLCATNSSRRFLRKMTNSDPDQFALFDANNVPEQIFCLDPRPFSIDAIRKREDLWQTFHMYCGVGTPNSTNSHGAIAELWKRLSKADDPADFEYIVADVFINQMNQPKYLTAASSLLPKTVKEVASTKEFERYGTVLENCWANFESRLFFQWSIQLGLSRFFVVDTQGGTVAIRMNRTPFGWFMAEASGKRNRKISNSQSSEIAEVLENHISELMPLAIEKHIKMLPHELTRII